MVSNQGTEQAIQLFPLKIQYNRKIILQQQPILFLGTFSMEKIVYFQTCGTSNHENFALNKTIEKFGQIFNQKIF